MRGLQILSVGSSALALALACGDGGFATCEDTRTCEPSGDGDGDSSTGGTGDGDGDGDTGGGDGDGDGDTGGTGIGDGDGDNTGGMGGDPNDPCLQCEGDTPHCNAADECVECLRDSHCGGDTPVCDVAAGLCLGCIDESDCEDPALPMCDGNTCAAGCTGPADCERFADTSVCDDAAGECVGCLSADNCGGDVCARATHTCVVGRVAHELSVCQACEYDDDCQVGQLCVEQMFDGTAVGNFCTWRKDGRAATASGTCSQNGKPYAGPGLGVTSVEGQVADLCVLRTTTCPAFLEHSQQVAGCSDESATSNAACGVVDIGDGLCRENAEDVPYCTYPCLSDEDCKMGATCTVDGYCSL